LATAQASGLNILCVEGTQIVSKLVGESEQNLVNLFKMARENSPSVIIIDQIEALAGKRNFSGSTAFERLLSCFLIELDGVGTPEQGQTGAPLVLVIATTQDRTLLDPAILRPGRMDMQILVPIPDRQARLEILELATVKMTIVNEDGKTCEKQALLDTIACSNASVGMTGADLTSLCREAALLTLRGNIEASAVPISAFHTALKQLRRRKMNLKRSN
jgi:transitional endoplasmic reticulum ATPase